jgi:hypothetical protein
MVMSRARVYERYNKALAQEYMRGTTRRSSTKRYHGHVRHKSEVGQAVEVVAHV